MVTATTFPWEDHSTPESQGRAAWRAAVADIAAKAHAKLPECNGRVDAAVKIVLAGDVALLPDGTARVASQSNGTTEYHIVNGHCDCKNFAKAPHGFCKHHLSAAIARRAQELVRAPRGDGTDQAAPPSPPTPAPLPEAPASVNVHVELAGRQVQLTLRDTDEGRLLARLEAVLQRFPLVVPPTSSQTRAEGWCAIHGMQMKLNHGKDGRQWWSHKTAEGWCKGK